MIVFILTIISASYNTYERNDSWIETADISEHVFKCNFAKNDTNSIAIRLPANTSLKRLTLIYYIKFMILQFLKSYYSLLVIS